MKQLYEVGESVLLMTTKSPDLNGEYIVLNSMFIKDCQVEGSSALYTGFIYAVGCVGPSGQDWWLESALKKKHNPSSMSYQELMTNLSTKIQERI